MRVTETSIPDLLILEPTVYGDQRGFFIETWNARNFETVTGVRAEFVQDNHSRSTKGVLRGLHYQVQQTQGKLVRVVNGAVFDVGVDLRHGSPTYGQWDGLELSEANNRLLWIPPGFAHGFLVLSASADFLYKTTNYYAPEHERCLAWNDPSVGIVWPLGGGIPVLSAKDKRGVSLEEVTTFTEEPDPPPAVGRQHQNADEST